MTLRRNFVTSARADLKVSKSPDDTRGKPIAFADMDSTSGWLIPSSQYVATDY